jgi:hypothetical protein
MKREMKITCENFTKSKERRSKTLEEHRTLLFFAAKMVSGPLVFSTGTFCTQQAAREKMAKKTARNN